MTIRRNNVLGPMVPYEFCYSSVPKPRVIDAPVRHGNGKEGNVEWEHFGSTKCRYDKKYEDERCQHDGVICQVYYDDEYVANLRSGS